MLELHNSDCRLETESAGLGLDFTLLP